MKKFEGWKPSHQNRSNFAVFLQTIKLGLAKTKLKVGKHQNCHLVFEGSFFVLFSSACISLVPFQFFKLVCQLWSGWKISEKSFITLWIISNLAIFLNLGRGEEEARPVCRHPSACPTGFWRGGGRAWRPSKPPEVGWVGGGLAGKEGGW